MYSTLVNIKLICSVQMFNIGPTEANRRQGENLEDITYTKYNNI